MNDEFWRHGGENSPHSYPAFQRSAFPRLQNVFYVRHGAGLNYVKVKVLRFSLVNHSMIVIDATISLINMAVSSRGCREEDGETGLDEAGSQSKLA